MEASAFVRTLQHRQGLNVCCPEEIGARLRGIISLDDLLLSARKFENSEYGSYLHSVHHILSITAMARDDETTRKFQVFLFAPLMRLRWTQPRRVVAKVEWHPRRALSARRLHRHQPVASGRAGRRLLQQARDVRAMDQGRQGRDQVDAAVVPDVRRQRRPAPASCAGLQSRQLPAHAGDARADQGLVADEPEGEADQDRREGGQPRPLRRLSDGRGRHPTADVPRDFAADRGTTAAATTSASVRRSIVMRSRATDGRSASKCQGKWPDQPLDHRSGCPMRWWPSSPRGCLAGRPEIRKYSRQIGSHLGIPVHSGVSPAVIGTVDSRSAPSR